MQDLSHRNESIDLWIMRLGCQWLHWAHLKWLVILVCTNSLTTIFSLAPWLEWITVITRISEWLAALNNMLVDQKLPTQKLRSQATNSNENSEIAVIAGSGEDCGNERSGPTYRDSCYLGCSLLLERKDGPCVVRSDFTRKARNLRFSCKNSPIFGNIQLIQAC